MPGLRSYRWSFFKHLTRLTVVSSCWGRQRSSETIARTDRSHQCRGGGPLTAGFGDRGERSMTRASTDCSPRASCGRCGRHFAGLLWGRPEAARVVPLPGPSSPVGVFGARRPAKPPQRSFKPTRRPGVPFPYQPVLATQSRALHAAVGRRPWRRPCHRERLRAFKAY